MADSERLQRMIDEYEIARVRRLWAFSRDHNDWSALESCFHPDATVIISWYAGSARASSNARRGRQEPQARRAQRALARQQPRDGKRQSRVCSKPTCKSSIATTSTGICSIARATAASSTCSKSGTERGASRNGHASTTRTGSIRSCRNDPRRLLQGLVFEGPANSCAFMKLRQRKKGRTFQRA